MNPTQGNITTITRLFQLLVVALLLVTSLATTGCGFVDGNEPDEIGRVITLEGGTHESFAVAAREEDDLGPIGDGFPFWADDNDPLKRLSSTIEQEPSDVAKEPEVDFSAFLIVETPHSITVRLSARVDDSNQYYVVRQMEGQAPVLVHYFNGSALFDGFALPAVEQTLTKDNTDRWVEYWIEDDGGSVVSARIRFGIPAQALP
ncbi:MAG: hypothetical protein IH820_15650 [Bacteroidetes bacterium]|nr:hypothetical protein [Bacteroidota bacterium]